MVKYKILNRAELQKLEKKFIDFLVINGISADDWVKIKAEAPDKARRLIELFSDVVYESRLRDVQFMAWIQGRSVLCFQCLKHKMVLVGIRTSVENKDVDFRDQHYLQACLHNPPPDLEVFSSERPYERKREFEIFEWLERGAAISDGHLFKTISLLYASS